MYWLFELFLLMGLSHFCRGFGLLPLANFWEHMISLELKLLLRTNTGWFWKSCSKIIFEHHSHSAPAEIQLDSSCGILCFPVLGTVMFSPSEDPLGGFLFAPALAVYDPYLKLFLPSCIFISSISCCRELSHNVENAVTFIALSMNEQ